MPCQKHLCVFVKFSPIIPPVSVSKETLWGQSELPDQMTVLVQSRSLASVFYFHNVLRKSFMNPVSRYCNFHQTKLNFTKSEDSQKTPHIPPLCWLKGWHLLLFAIRLFEGENTVFLKLPIWHLRVLLDVEKLSSVHRLEGKKARGIILYFSISWKCSRPCHLHSRTLFCTIKAPGIALTHGAIFWWMSRCVSHTGPILYFCYTSPNLMNFLKLGRSFLSIFLLPSKLHCNSSSCVKPLAAFHRRAACLRSFFMFSWSCASTSSEYSTTEIYMISSFVTFSNVYSL